MSAEAKSHRIIIIGAGGFIGRHLVDLMQAEGAQVSALTREVLDLQSQSSKSRLLDLLQENDRLIFLAAITPDRGKDIAAMLSNLDMMKYFIPVLEERRCAHLTYISSDAVYPDTATLIDEQTHCDPKSLYGVAHITREKMLLDVTTRRKIPFLRIRPSAVYGTGDSHNSYGPNRFLKSARNERKISLSGQGEEQRDHMYIGDLCRLIKRFTDMKSEGVFNAATGVATSFDEVAQLVRGAVSSMPDGSNLDKEIELAYSPRQQPIVNRHFDISALRRIFPDFSFTSLAEGLKRSTL